jgi:hypothetical protein
VRFLLGRERPRLRTLVTISTAVPRPQPGIETVTMDRFAIPLPALLTGLGAGALAGAWAGEIALWPGALALLAGTLLFVWGQRRSSPPGSPGQDRVGGLHGLDTRVEQILRLAEQQAQDHREEAEQEAVRILAEARAEARSILDRARTDAAPD